jgi:Interleukin 7/9 family.
MMNSLLEKLCMIKKGLQTLTTVAESSAFVEHLSTVKSQSLAIKTMSSKQSGSKKPTNTTEKSAAVSTVGRLAI